jgi:hypothetical protein
MLLHKFDQINVVDTVLENAGGDLTFIGDRLNGGIEPPTGSALPGGA